MDARVKPRGSSCFTRASGCQEVRGVSGTMSVNIFSTSNTRKMLLLSSTYMYNVPCCTRKKSYEIFLALHTVQKEVCASE